MADPRTAISWAGVSGTDPVLTSLWDGLSPHLIASFWEVQRAGSSRNWEEVRGGPVVKAPLTDANLEVIAGWQSPFEDAGQGMMPTVKAMMSSGALQPWAGGDPGGAASKFVSAVEGRAGITKLNSTQVFHSMPPLKITVTALFRAWRDSASEVEAPVNQLMKWALPHALADDGVMLTLLENVKQVARGKPLDEAAAHAFLPSVAPAKIAMMYKNRIYSPMVIESIGMPINSPVDANGRFVQLAIPMTLCSLSAIDRKDWENSGNSFSGYGGFRS